MESNRKKISIVGAGSWGFALGLVLNNNGFDVMFWTRNDNDVNSINTLHKNKYFPNILLNDSIRATSSLKETFEYSDFIIISIPVVSINDLLKEYILQYSEKKFLMTSKGLFNGNSLSRLFESYNPNVKYAVLSGPSFAKEVVERKKTAVVIASKDECLSRFFQSIFNNDYFKVYTSTDVIGVEFCGAVKNVMAIVAGMIDSKGMGYNTKNAVITRSLYEMGKMLSFIGGKKETLYGLAGIGDLMLTCNSFDSRNYTFGYNFNSNMETNKTVEGINTLFVIYEFSKKQNIEMPIIESLFSILNGDSTIEIETVKLMSRGKKDEFAH